ncbi:hypothetical protein ACFL5O_08945 [Myxococcota bacterium]
MVAAATGTHSPHARAGIRCAREDNFAPEEVQEAVARTRGRALVEVSGRVGPQRLAELAELGVNIVSVGALTHSAPAADIALDIERVG